MPPGDPPASHRVWLERTTSSHRAPGSRRTPPDLCECSSLWACSTAPLSRDKHRGPALGYLAFLAKQLMTGQQGRQGSCPQGCARGARGGWELTFSPTTPQPRGGTHRRMPDSRRLTTRRKESGSETQSTEPPKRQVATH